jgi:signal transduction histidine kinase
MMENLINDLLDLAKLENMSFTISSEYFDLGELIFEAFKMIAHKADEMKVKLFAEIDQRKNLEKIALIWGDQRRFLQILLNFLSNAMKFTNPNGTVSVKIDVLDEQSIESDDGLEIHHEPHGH